MPPLDDTTYSGTTASDAPSGSSREGLSGGNVKLSYDDIVKRAMAKGYSKAGAQGIAKNFIRESDGNTGWYGDGHTSLGLGQWHKDRMDDLFAFAKERGKPPQDPDVQWDFFDKEMREKYPTLRSQLVTATDPDEAEDRFKRIYERPASIMWGNTPQQLASDKYRFSDYALNEHKGKPNTDILMMSPGDYLDLSPDLEGKPFESPSGRALKKSVDKGDQIESIPTLDTEVRGPTAVVTDQDGRHRALMAQQEGLTSIPVAVRQNGEGNPTELQGMKGDVRKYDFPKAESVPQSLWKQALSMIISPAEAATLGPRVDYNPFDESPPGNAQPAQQAQQAPTQPAAPAAPAQQGAAEPRVILGPKVNYNPFETTGPDGGQQGEKDYSDWDKPTVRIDPITQQAVPLQKESGYQYGSVIPARWKPDAQGNAIPGTRELAIPEAIRAPVRGVVEAGQGLLGERPYTPEIAGDIASAVGMFGGARPTFPTTRIMASAIRPAAAAAREAGYVLPPNELSEAPGIVSNSLAALAGKIKTEQAASIKNQAVTNGLAAKALGLPAETPLTDEVLDAVRETAGAAYKAVRDSVPTIEADDAFKEMVAGLGGRTTEAAQAFPNTMKVPGLDDLIEDLSVSGPQPTSAWVQLVKKLRRDSTALLKGRDDPIKLDLGLAKREAANAIDDMMERQIDKDGAPGAVQAYRQARQLIAKSYDVDAATNPATHEVSARALAALQAKGRPLTGELKAIADTAAAFPKAMQSPATFGRTSPWSVLDAVAAAAAAAHGNYGLMATILSRPIARAGILSDPFQNALARPLRPSIEGAPLVSRLLPDLMTSSDSTQGRMNAFADLMDRLPQTSRAISGQGSAPPRPSPPPLPGWAR